MNETEIDLDLLENMKAGCPLEWGKQCEQG